MTFFTGQPRVERVAAVFAVVLCSALAALGILGFHDNWTDLLEASQGVLTGEPHWRAYQNRLLGPLSVSALSALTGNGEVAFQLFVALGVLLHGVLLFALLLYAFGSFVRAALGVVVWSAGTQLLNHFWLHSWDIYDLFVFTLVSFAVIVKGSVWWLYPLYGVALMNRESALAIPFAMLASDLLRHNAHAPPRFGRVSTRGSMMAYLAAFFVGLAWTKLVRDLLFVRSSLVGDDNSHMLLGNHNQFQNNLQVIGLSNLSSGQAMKPWALFAFCGFLIWLFRRHKHAGLRAGIVLFWAYVALLFVAARIDETRVLLPLLSLGIFILFAAFNDRKPWPR